MTLNGIIKYLIISDFIILTGFGFIAPIFAVFILQNINGGTLEIVGFATSVNVFTKAVFELPIARYLDKKRGDLDEFYFMVFGSLTLSIAPLLYLLIKTPFELYAAQFVYGIGLAMAYPSWMSLFTRHAEKEREGSQWAVYSVATGIGAAISAAVGGMISERYGFSTLFAIVFFMTILGTVSLLKIYEPLRIRHEHHKIKQKEAFEIKEAERNQ